MDINGFQFVEDAVNKSPTRRWAAENCSTQRRLYAPYLPDADDLDLRALAILGGTEVLTENVDGITRAWISRHLPHAYPGVITYENPEGLDFQYATSIPSAEPCSRPEGADADARSVYSWYRYNVVYESQAHNLYRDDEVLATGSYADANGSPLAAFVFDGTPARPDEGDALRRGWLSSRFVVKQVKPGARTISLPQGFVKLQAFLGKFGVGTPGGPGQALPESVAYTQARLSVDYFWLCVPDEAVPEQFIQLALNRLNNQTFDKWPMGTLLLADAAVKKYRSATGRRISDLHYHCLFLPNRDQVSGDYVGWNSVLKVIDNKVRCWPISGNGVSFSPTADSDNKIFQHCNFAGLFRPPWPYV